MENAEGQVEIVDLTAGEFDPYVSTSDVSYDLYTRTNQNSRVTITNNDVNALANTNFDSKKKMFLLPMVGLTIVTLKSIQRFEAVYLLKMMSICL